MQPDRRARTPAATPLPHDERENTCGGWHFGRGGSPGVGAGVLLLYADGMSPRSLPTLPAHPDVTVSSDQRVWNGRFPLDVVKFRHRRFDGTLSGEKTWEVWRRGRAAAVLPYDPVADAVVLIEQFRLPALAAGLGPVLVELPAGLCDDGESPEVTARREAGEEMGVEAGDLRG